MMKNAWVKMEESLRVTCSDIIFSENVQQNFINKHVLKWMS